MCVLAILLRHMQRGRGYGGSGVAAEGFEDEIQGCFGRVERAIVVQGTEEQFAIDHR
ncbi:hypothetical protein D9M72_637050 [compost metagenome]